jgi:uroporphyrinogen decarboxylase
LEQLGQTPNDVIGLDWAVDMRVARTTLGASVRVQGNLDPMILFGPEEVSRRKGCGTIDAFSSE